MTPAEATKLFAGDCDFLRATALPEQFPPSKLPEVAFWGRSNVGKSSFINALTGRKSLARASKTPGRTQEIIFFDLGHRLMLVDLPGYGHAKAPRAEQDRWNDLIRRYLAARPPLRLVCLLIDGRHGALANDLAMMQVLDRAGISYQAILTKIDQVHATEWQLQADAVAEVIKEHPAARHDVFATSSEKKLGIEEMRVFLAGFAENISPKLKIR